MTQSSVAHPNATFSAAVPDAIDARCAKAGMVEPLVRGEIVGVAIGGAGERAARGQRGKAVLRSEGIEIKREGRRCKNYASNAREDSENETAFVIMQ